MLCYYNRTLGVVRARDRRGQRENYSSEGTPLTRRASVYKASSEDGAVSLRAADDEEEDEEEGAASPPAAAGAGEEEEEEEEKEE